MKKSHIAASVVALLLLAAVALPAWSDDAGQEPWRELYTGEEASGPNVIGLWQFLPGRETEDSSGNGHTLTLRGESRFVTEGPFGAALESFPADTENDVAQGALVANTAALSPAGAFTIEAWFSAKPEMENHERAVLIDKKYFHYARDLPEANCDYAIALVRSGPNKRRISVTLGFGENSDFITGPEIDVVPGEWVHLAYTYDGEGRSRFFVNGKLLHKLHNPGRGAVTAGRYNLVIGDRHGSTHNGFPGYIAQVRLSNGIVPYFTGGLVAEMSGGRTAFQRMEQDVNLTLNIVNDTTETLRDARAEVIFGETRQEIPLPALAPNEEAAVPLPFDTGARPGEYMLQVVASAKSGDRDLQIAREIPVTIVPRPAPNQMPVVMWGGGDIERLNQIGLSHMIVHIADYKTIWDAGEPVEAVRPAQLAANLETLDNLLKAGLYATAYLYPGRWVTRDENLKALYNRVNRQGELDAHDNVCGNFPEVREYSYNVGASVAKTFGSHPALDSSLVHSEVRDGTSLCFHDHDRQMFREAAGYDIPDEVMSKSGVRYNRINDFPANRVIPDDDPILGFYRWFWKDGDGWNPLHTELDRGLKSTGRRDLWTFFDPAVRVPSLWGSGGDVDIVSQWTYSYPDPIKMGQATDELFAMAEGKEGQKVMKMTQVIWYRTGTAPNLPEDEADRAPWEISQPEAPFITIAPDHMREAFWAKISRPIRGIMYHGWGSLVETGATTGYVYTNPESKEVLTELVRDVIRPLGPMLLEVPDRPTDVALLESFSSQMFAGRGSYGWSQSWEADMHLILQWAHLQPRIVYDETVVRDGLDAYNVLVMPFCDVLTESVVARIKEFQARGGIIIADEFLCPAIVPDIVIPAFRRTTNAQQDKAALLERVEALRQELDPFYNRYGEASDADIVVRFRQYGDSDYLFALNDRREYGDYVGHHGRVMEKGLPLSGTILVRRNDGVVYDLVRHQPVPVRKTAEGMEIDANFGPGDGKLLLITDREIADIAINAPAQARLGRSAGIDFTVTDATGTPMSAVIPVEVEIIDAQGRTAEFSGSYAAKDGRFSIRLNVAENDATGAWTVRARELASGRTSERQFNVAP